MINLLIKDFYLIKKHLWIGFFYSFMMFFIFSPQVFEVQGMVYVMGMTMIGYTMLMYTTAYDDKNNSEILLNSLPISRKEIVLSRYLSVIIFAIIGAFNMLIAGFVMNQLNVFGIRRLMEIEDFFGALIGLCILSFLYLPTYFKFGYLKAKMFNLFLFAIAFGAPIIIRNLIQSFEKPLWIDDFVIFIETQSDIILSIALLVLLLVIGFISYSFSIMVYRKREF